MEHDATNLNDLSPDSSESDNCYICMGVWTVHSVPQEVIDADGAFHIGRTEPSSIGLVAHDVGKAENWRRTGTGSKLSFLVLYSHEGGFGSPIICPAEERLAEFQFWTSLRDTTYSTSKYSSSITATAMSL